MLVSVVFLCVGILAFMLQTKQNTNYAAFIIQLLNIGIA